MQDLNKREMLGIGFMIFSIFFVYFSYSLLIIF